MTTIGVCCKDSETETASARFAGFLAATRLQFTITRKREATIGQLVFQQVTTELDAQGRSFDGVVRLDQLPPAVEECLIACMRPPTPL